MNTSVTLRRRPTGKPVPEDFELVQSEIPEPGAGEALVENLFISLDAGFRNWMDEDAGDDDSGDSDSGDNDSDDNDLDNQEEDED